MGYEFTGKVLHVGEVEEFKGGTFKKRTFVLEKGGPYPEPIPFELTGDKLDQILPGEEGKTASVQFDLSGRYWEQGEKYFASNRAWRVKIGGTEAPTTSAGEFPADPPTPEEQKEGTDGPLPF